MATNVGPDANSRDVHLWKSFDRLPREARQAIAAAPYDYEVTPFLDELNAHVRVVGRRHAVSVCEIEWARQFGEDVFEAAGAIYGPDHPQAKESRPWRAR